MKYNRLNTPASLTGSGGSAAPDTGRAPLPPGSGTGRRAAARRTALPGGRYPLALALFLCLLPALLAVGVCRADVPVQGSLIINTASVTAMGLTGAPESSATVTCRIPTRGTIEFMQYSPALPDAQQVPVVTGAYQPGTDPAVPMAPLPPPRRVGADAPIDLSQPVPLAPALQLHQGDPLFIRVTDPDNNMDRTLRDTVTVTLTATATGDTETIRLTETGPDTGVFAGYIPSTKNIAEPYNGLLQVTDGSGVTALYTDRYDHADTADTAIMVDPYGIVFDSTTGLPVNGATVTIIDAATGLPAAIFGDDGISSYPSTLSSGGTARDASGAVYAFPPGGYRFPFSLPGNYRLQVTPPKGYTVPSTETTAAIQALPGGPFAIVAGSRGETFPLNPGPALRIDIPAAPAAASLWVQKTAGKGTAAVGEFVTYELSVTNTDALAPAVDVVLTDTMPPGFRFRRDSVTLNGAPGANPAVSRDGRTLSFSVGTLAPNISATVRFVAEITAGAAVGQAVNILTAAATGGGTSNLAKAVVTVRDDLLRSRSILMGRVTTGACGEESGEGADGIEGARVYLEDGSFVISDKQGLFHFEGVRPGLHVLQLDLDSLPDGFEANPCTENSRFAGRAFSQFVETQGGTLWRTDFHLRNRGAEPPRKPGEEAEPLPAPAVSPAVPDPAPARGKVALELSNRVTGRDIAYTVSTRASSMPVQSTRLTVMLPEGVSYRPGSSRMDGVPIADPVRRDKNGLEFHLGALPENWNHEVTFTGHPTAAAASSILATQAYLAADNAGGSSLLTPPAETSVELDKSIRTIPIPDIVLHPRFPSFGAELNEDDRGRLDELARLLTVLRADRIHVTGHTDTVRIAPRSRGVYQDNRALSLARARSVGRYLMDRLHLPPERLTLDGKGSTVPVASNRTARGRALNRRVEVQISTSRSIDASRLSVLREFSGVQQSETAEEESAGGASLPGSGSSAAETIIRSVVAAPAADAPAAAPPATGTKEPAAAKPAPAPDGVLFPTSGELLLDRIYSVQCRIDAGLTPKLFVDGSEVPADRIGFKSVDHAADRTLYGYVGVDFGEPGQHTVEIRGIDPFGNVRFSRKSVVTRTGEIARIRLVSADGNIADGKTPVRIRVELFDGVGNPLRGSTRLGVRNGTLKPLLQNADNPTLDDKTAASAVTMDSEGWLSFQPVTSSGTYRTVIGYNDIKLEVETYVQPKLRDWILVGLAEGTAGHSTASGNMVSLTAGEAREDFYQDGRIAFFAKGRIKGEWLLTMSYDSAKSMQDSGTSLFQHIDPDSYYTLYGDSTQQQYDAASSRKLYLKVERNQFYAMFGDYDTGLSVTELSRYSRRMTGIKSEYQGKLVEASGFAAETTQMYQRDEIPGDGTSGLYRLKRRPLVINSEQISIVTRDRFRSEVIISTRTLSRFIDYAIDYEAGTIFFKLPVASKDENFNPITIVAEYEVLSDAGRDYTYGGRVGVKLLDQRLKIGASHVHEGVGEKKNDLAGVDTTVMITDNTKLRAEAAGTESDSAGVKVHGYAYLAELTHTSKLFDGKVHFREQQGGFGLGQQMGSESATRKYGLEGVYRLNESFSSSASLNRQTNLALSTERDVAEGKVSYTDKRYSTYLGLLHADDRLADRSSRSSGQITAGGKLLTLKERLTLSVDHAQSVWGNSNVDFPTRTMFGAEYKVNAKVTLLGAQEFTWGETADTSATRLGVRSTPWKGGTFTSTVERQLNENSSRLFGSMGLRQSWQLTDEWKVDAGLDRSQTIVKKASYTLNPAVPPASGGAEDFTAVSTGATYLVKGLTWDSRFEYRTSDSEDKFGVLSGVVKEQGDGWAWSARGQFFQTDAAGGVETRRANIRLGLVYRPPQTRWIHLNRFDVIHEELAGGGQSDLTSWRLVNNYTANFRPDKRLQLSLKYGAKYVMDTIADRRYDSFTDHWGTEIRYDITKQWDVGLRGSVLHSWNGGQFAYSGGASVGYNIFDNAWVSLGYNAWGFSDRDFSAADYTASGPYVRFRIKFDQQTVKDAAGWLNRQ